MKKLIFLTFFLIVSGIIFFLFIIPLLTPNNGQLSVTTKQPKVSVFLNGKKLGETPFSSKTLKVGDYDLVLIKGVISWKSKITLTSNTQSLVDADLSSATDFTSATLLSFTRGQKSLLVLTKPNEASVFLDHKDQGKSPQKYNSLSASHLTLDKPGYLSREAEVSLQDGYSTESLVYLSVDPFGQVKKLEGDSKLSLFSLYNSVVDLSKDYSAWAEGVKHTQESFSGDQTRFDVLLDPTGKTYILYPEEWANKVTTRAVANIGYLAREESGQLTEAAKVSWEKIQTQFK